MRDWRAWHDQYDDPESRLSGRLRVVQRLIRRAVDDARPGPVRVLSMCAGQCRDVVGALAHHRRAPEVSGRAVELDEHNATVGRAALAGSGLGRIEMVVGDAGTASAYEGATPADVLLVCGVFGNISDEDIQRTIGHLDRLATSGATVIWTRGVGDPDLTPTIRSWFADAGWRETRYESRDLWGVGAHRLVEKPRPYEGGVRLFSFVAGKRGAVENTEPGDGGA